MKESQPSQEPENRGVGWGNLNNNNIPSWTTKHDIPFFSTTATQGNKTSFSPPLPMTSYKPVGELLPTHLLHPIPPLLKRERIDGTRISLVPPNPNIHAPSLYAQLRDQPSLWTYMPGGPFPTETSFHEHLVPMATSLDPVYFIIEARRDLPKPTTTTTSENNDEKKKEQEVIPAGTPLGYLSLLAIDRINRIVEVGYIMFGPGLQRTAAATEALYLAMRLALGNPTSPSPPASIQTMGARRLEWKCDSLNAGSRRAALRLGFTYEGLFRQHRIVKGRNRDTAWFSITDREWRGDNGKKYREGIGVVVGGGEF